MSPETKSPRSVAIIGAGAVGGYYGGRLAEAGHDVRFLLRRDYEAVQRHGLRVESIDGDFHLQHPTIARDSAEIGPVDWVVCALKATSIEQAEALIRPCVGPETRLLLIMNGLGIEERFAAWFGAQRIFGGLAFTCINRGEPGVIHHMRYGALTIAHLQNDAAALAEAASLWSGARVQVGTAPSLLQARWEKLCWNIPFNGMTITAGAVSTDRVMTDPRLREESRLLMEEVVAAGNADLARHGEAGRIDGAAMMARMFALTETMGDYRPSTLIDFEAGLPLEIDSIFGEPLRRARELGVPSPRMSLQEALLRSLDRRERP